MHARREVRARFSARTVRNRGRVISMNPIVVGVADDGGQTRGMESRRGPGRRGEARWDGTGRGEAKRGAARRGAVTDLTRDN